MATSLFFNSVLNEGAAIACIQDACLISDRPKGLPSGKTIYSSLNKNCHIIIFRPSIIHCQAYKTLTSIFANLVMQRLLITIFTQYTPPSMDLKIDLKLVLKTFPLFSKELLFLGDLNNHRPLWSY